MKKDRILPGFRTGTCLIVLSIIFSRCSDEELTSGDIMADPKITAMSASGSIDCSQCTYIVPANTHIIDGTALGLQPGNIIGLNADISYGSILFRNITGSPEKPIIIRNCNGMAVVNGASQPFSIKTENSKYFRITGGNTPGTYGISITGGSLGITLDKLSTNFQVDHVEVSNTGFAGIMAKTDPTCDDATIRGNFIMKNVYINDNYVHDTGGEAIYVGNSFYANGMNRPCGQRFPHEIHYLKVNNNIVRNAGWDGIQVGCVTKGARIYGNTIENYGTANKANERNGLQISEGTGGICYGNTSGMVRVME